MENEVGSQESKGVIYGLYNQGVLFYIGQSRNLKKRYAQHCSLTQNRKNRLLNQFLTKILISGHIPEIEVIEYTDSLDEREIFWISYYKSKNVSLVNMTNGGNDIVFLRKAKEKMPWENSYSPVQRRLKSIKETLNHFKRSGDLKRVESIGNKLIILNRVISNFGLARMNIKLWEKYGY